MSYSSVMTKTVDTLTRGLLLHGVTKVETDPAHSHPSRDVPNRYTET